MPEKTIVEIFKEMNSLDDVASLLDVKPATLAFLLYKKPFAEQYTEFDISKKNGSPRHICAPTSSLSFIQKKLNQKLQALYKFSYPNRKYVHGFIEGRSIIGNATRHVKKQHVLNIDLLDFFPQLILVELEECSWGSHFILFLQYQPF